MEEEQNIVSGIANFSGSGALGPKTQLAKKLEDAFSEAILKCLEQGIPVTDTEAMLAAKKEAYDRVVAEHYAPVVPEEPPQPTE